MPDSFSPQHMIKLLNELRQLPKETGWVEFKVNKYEPEEIGEYISALANSAALEGRPNAYIVWGVEDGSHKLVGTTFRPNEAQIGNEELESWLLRLLSPRIHFQIREIIVEGKLISMIIIPRASHRPVQFQGQEYIRVGSYKKKLKDFPEMEADLWRVFDTTPFEDLVAADHLSGAEVLKILDYPAYFRLLDLELPETRDGILARLSEDAMICQSEDGHWEILNLGAVLFAADLSRFRHLGRKAVRVVEYIGKGRDRTKREHQDHKGYGAGFEGLIDFLNTILPENEEIRDAIRKKLPMYPEVAIRELAANMIIHQDFTMTGTGPMIEVFEGRLEITNPGVPLMEPDRFLDTPPRSRNEALASFLRRAGICEERGSGIDKVVLQTEIHQLPAPLFEVASDHTRAVLFSHKEFPEMDKSDRIRACYLHACLQYVRRERMTNRSLRERFGIEARNRAQISRIISDTIEAGLLRPHDLDSGSRKHRSYVPYWA